MTFDEHVRAALDELPPHLAKALENVAVVVEDEHPEDPDLFGLYEGIPLTERSSWDAGSLPDRITIYRRPLEEEFPTRGAPGRDPDHRAARAGAPVRHRRGPARRARLRLTSTALNSPLTEDRKRSALGRAFSSEYMRNLDTIHAEIEQLSEDRGRAVAPPVGGPRRGDRGRDQAPRRSPRGLWDEYRATRAALRFGDRSRIVARARAEERLERAA